MSLRSKLGLKKDERVLMIVRSSPVVVVMPLIIAMLFLLAPFFFLLPLLLWEKLGMIIIGISFGAGAFFGLRVMMKWFGTMTVITNRRLFIVRRDGYLVRKVHILPFTKIQGVSYRVKGILQTLFRYGTVLIRPISGKPLRIVRIHHPEFLEGYIAEAIEEAEAGDFGDLLHAVSDMNLKELNLLRAEIDRTLRYRE